jgi:hypothetical protein
MYCNQKCIAHIFMAGAHVECNANPITSNEYKWSADPAPARVAKKVPGKRDLLAGRKDPQVARTGIDAGP